ncbi:MAG: EpsG family protein [Rikenellaceae bacterium]|nr:EpsG family protein [Rikenellaceae bacterium]
MNDYLYIIFYILGLVALVGIVTNFRQKGSYLVTYLGFLLLFFLLSFLRWERGADWTAYQGMYDKISSLSDATAFGDSFETGYKYLAGIVHAVFDSYTVFLFVQACIITFCMGRTIWRYSPSPIFSLFVYFALIFANIFFVRQYVAIAITMFAFTYIVQRRFWKFALCVLVAMQFHSSALIFLLAYPLYKWRFSTPQLIWSLALSILLSLLLSRVMLTLFGSMGGFVGDKIANYLGATEGGSGSMKLPTLADLAFGLLSRVFMVVSVLFFLGKSRLKDVRLNGIVNFYLFGIVLYSFTAPISLALVRIVNYYDFFMILLLPYILYVPGRLLNRFLLALIFSLYLFTRFMSLNNQYSGEGYASPFSPYKSIFDKQEQVDGVY